MFLSAVGGGKKKGKSADEAQGKKERPDETRVSLINLMSSNFCIYTQQHPH